MPGEYSDPVIYWRKKVRGRVPSYVAPLWRSNDGIKAQYNRQLSIVDSVWEDTHCLVVDLDRHHDFERCNQWGLCKGDPPCGETDAEFARRMVESIAVAWWMRNQDDQ